MKRIITILLCLLCTIGLMAEKHMKFRTLTIEGELKTAMKEVKKWGFMGMKIKNVAAMVGELDGEDVLLTLVATPESLTLFSVTIIYEGVEQWEEQLAKYDAINASIAAQYGEATEVISEWETPYSVDNQPGQALRENKGNYGSVYSTAEGKVAVNIVCIDGKMCTMVAYIDEQNSALFLSEGGKDINISNEEVEEATSI